MAVGMAAWVSAILVNAAAASVLGMSIVPAVGVACGTAPAPQALRINMIMSACTSTGVRIEKCFMWTSPRCFRLARISPLLRATSWFPKSPPFDTLRTFKLNSALH